MLLSDAGNRHSEASIEYRLLIGLWCKIEYTTTDTL
jgi:hypothetical protein